MMLDRKMSVGSRSTALLLTLISSAMALLHSNGTACVGSSANLAPAECAAMQQLFSDWNMAQYNNCNVLDPCSCTNTGRFGPNAIYCDTDSDGTGFVQGISLTALNPPMTGTISEAIGNLTRMNIMFLDGNALTGTIPKAFVTMTHLASLNLLANQLSGTIPAGLPQTQLLSLGCNKFTGVVPQMDFQSLHSQDGCDINDDAEWCATYFGQNSSNTFSCPLPPDAAQYCNAKCSVLPPSASS